MLPGIDLTRSSPELMGAVENHMNPLKLHPYQAMCLSRRVDRAFLTSAFFEATTFYLYYTRHDCPKKNRIHRADRQSTLAFLEERIHPERGQGLDLVITTEEMSDFLICSHDGDMFFRTPSEWPSMLSEAANSDAEVLPDVEPEAQA